MKRLASVAFLLLSLLVAAGPSAGSTTRRPAPAAAARTATLTGRIAALGGVGLTIQTPGPQVGVIAAMTRAANTLTTARYPYVWGGGHGVAGLASVGIKGGPGANGRRHGFDCSGSVAAVLEAAGLWPAGAGVPNDAGVIRQLLADHVIARGAGTAPRQVTLYDHPGVHIFMNIDGRFFGTSDGAGGGNPKGGPGWLADGAPDASSRAFKRYHVLPAVLRDRTAYGHIFGFQVDDPTLVAGAEIGDKVTVAYQQLSNGSMLARTLAYTGAVTRTGTVVSIGAGGSSLVLSVPGGATITLATALVPELLGGVGIGDSVQVSYSKGAAGGLVPHALSILSAATGPTGASGVPTGPTGATGGSWGASGGSWSGGSPVAGRWSANER